MADTANGWEILNALAQTVGAVGTTGALLVAAFTYRRQVDNQRRAQASRVLMRTKHTTDAVTFELRNDSDQPVTNVQLVETAPFPFRGAITQDPELRRIMPGASHGPLWPTETVSWVFPEPADEAPRVAAMWFIDSAGRQWLRTPSRLGEIRWRTARHPVHLYRRSRAWLSGHAGRPPEGP